MQNSNDGRLINEGLFKMLQPKTIKFCGYNKYRIIIMFLTIYLTVLSMWMLACCVYYWPNNIVDAVLYFGAAENFLFSCYKVNVIVYNSSEIWNCLSITRFNFTSYGCRATSVLKTARIRTISYALFLSSFTFAGLVYSLSCPFIYGKSYNKLENHDGSFSIYRLNIVDMYLFVSDETYNKYFYFYYFIETSLLVVFVLFLIIFDTIFVTLTTALSCQFQVICTAFESLGHDYFPVHQLSSVTGIKKVLTNNTDVYQEIKTLIKDHQAVIRKLEEFIDIFKWPILSQIFVSSTTLLILCIFPTMNLIDEEILDHGPISTKLMLCVPIVTFQIFLMCYLCDIIHHEKDAFIFALYSCNWTEMDLKCKKLILLAMRLNNAHQMKIKFTYMAIVNLELFSNMMKFCYSVFSMLVNYKKSMKQ